MNKENILAVADAIERHTIPDLGFNMGLIRGTADAKYPDKSGFDCGTVACIAGWTNAVAGGEGVDAAGDYLGIEGDRLRSKLFYPDNPYLGATPAQAGRVIRHLAETGEVDWSVANYVATSEPTNAR